MLYVNYISIKKKNYTFSKWYYSIYHFKINLIKCYYLVLKCKSSRLCMFSHVYIYTAIILYLLGFPAGSGGEGNGTPLQYSCLENPWTEEPGRLQSMGSLRVGNDWATSLSLFTFMHWRRKWQPTPGFLPGESQGRGSLVGCCLWVAQSRTRLKRLSSSSSKVLLLVSHLLQYHM